MDSELTVEHDPSVRYRIDEHDGALRDSPVPHLMQRR
jgi:hypothetical protein